MIFWLTAGLTLGLLALTMFALIADRRYVGSSVTVVLVLWEMPAIGYVVWWLMGRSISRALAIYAHSYTVFMALVVASTFAGHDTALAIFLAPQVVGLVAVPVTGRVHRRRAR